MTNLRPVDVAIVGGGWTGLAMAKEITTRSGLNVVVLEKELRPDMQLLIVESATHGARETNEEFEASASQRRTAQVPRFTFGQLGQIVGYGSLR
jgi:2-polyprenyl-6-methoxyphenol hydroxylase-like FAD-dependent oxidoreductase